MTPETGIIWWNGSSWTLEVGGEAGMSTIPTVKAAFALARRWGVVARRAPGCDVTADGGVLDHETGERWANVPAARAGETAARYSARVARWARSRDRRLIPHGSPGGAAVTVRVDGTPDAYLTVRA